MPLCGGSRSFSGLLHSLAANFDYAFGLSLNSFPVASPGGSGRGILGVAFAWSLLFLLDLVPPRGDCAML